MSTGEKIKHNRKRLCLTRERLGELVGVTRRAVSYYECGERFPDLATLAKMARVFGIDPVSLLPDWFINYATT